MPKMSATVESVDQIVDADLELEGIVTRPKHIRRWFTNNIFRRMFAYLVGWDGTHFRVVNINEDGALSVVESGGGYDDIEVQKGNGGTSYSTYAFTDKKARAVMIQIWDHPAYFKSTYDGTNWTSEMELSADSVYSIPVKSFAFQVKNKAAGNVARFEVWGFKNWQVF